MANLPKFTKFQKFQLDNLVDFEKCCQTRIYLQNFVLIQPKTSKVDRQTGTAGGALLPSGSVGPSRMTSGTAVVIGVDDTDADRDLCRRARVPANLATFSKI